MAFPTGWSGYEEVYIIDFPSSGTGQIFHTHTSGFSSSWKSVVASDGRDIRVTTANGNRLPVDVIYMDAGNGYLEFNLTGLYSRDPRERIRFWVGNTGATFEDATGIYGQYAVYPDYLYGYYPTGGGLDRTRNQNHLTGTNTQTGQNFVGLRTTLYNGSAYSMCNVGITGNPLSLSLFYNTSVNSGNQTLIGLFNSNSTGSSMELRLRGTDDRTTITARGQTTINVLIGDNFETGVWGQIGGSFVADNNRNVYTNGINQNSTSTRIIPSGLNRFGIGAFLGSSISGYSSASVCLAEVYTGVKNDTQFLYDYVSSTGNFYSTGWRPAFNPVGWSGYDEVSIIYEASGNLYDQVYLLSTALLSNTLLTVANTSGTDLRITKTDNATELPIDVINFNKSQTGMIAFAWPGVKISGQQDKIRVWAGNTGISQYPDTGVFGKYSVYNTGILGFYPDGGGDDRTRNQLNMNRINVSPGGLAGPLSGLKATNYSSIGTMSAVAFPSAEIRWPLNIWSVFWTNITNQDQIVAAAGVSTSNSRYNNAIRLNSSTGVTHHLDVNAGSLEVIARSGYSASNWYSADAYNNEGIVKSIYFNGKHQNSGSVGITFGISNMSIGAYSGATVPATGLPLNGRVSLTSFDMSKRYGYEPIYNHEMIFNHNNFYNGAGWTPFTGFGGGGGSEGSLISIESIVNAYTYTQGMINVNLNFGGNIYSNTSSIGDIRSIVRFVGSANSTTNEVGVLQSNFGLQIEGSDGSVTSSAANLNMGVGFAGQSNSRTFSSLEAAVIRLLEAEINARTSGQGVVLRGIDLSANSANNTQIEANVILSIPLSSLSEVLSSLNGTLTIPITGCTIEDNIVEFVVYLTMNSENPLYISRNKTSTFVHLQE
jgi:hypothetical protein